MQESEKKQLCRITLSANAGFSLVINQAGDGKTGEDVYMSGWSFISKDSCESEDGRISKDNSCRISKNSSCRISKDSSCRISKDSSLRLWFDALHEQSVNEFSTLSENIIEKMLTCEDFFWPDAIAYTHCHKDHFSAALTEQAMGLWPEAAVILPEKIFHRQITIDEEKVIRLKGATLDFFRSTHEGEEYKDTPHYACLIKNEGASILVTGDSEVGGSMMKEKLAERGMLKEDSPDIVIADFPWITLNKGRKALEEWLWPRHLVINHLPFKEEDNVGFNETTAIYADRLKPRTDVVVMNKALQQETIAL